MTSREAQARQDAIEIRCAAIRTEMQALSDAAGHSLLAADAQTRWDALTTEADALTTEKGVLAAQQRRQASIDDLDRRAAGTPLNGAPVEGRTVRFNGRDVVQPEGFDGAVLVSQDGARVPVLEARHRLASFAPAEQRGADVSFGQFLRALYLGPQNDTERRALAEATIGTGGAIVPTPLAAGIIDLLRAKSVAFRAGARTVPMNSQTLRFARLIADPVGAWRAENAPIAEGEPAFDQVSLTAKSWALLTKVSRELLEDGQNTDSVLREVFAASAALALDRAVMFGSGTANQPLGIASTPGIQAVSMGTNGGKLTNWAPMLDAVAALEAVNAGTVSAMVAAPRTARAVYGFADAGGQPLTTPPRLAGIPLLTTTSASITETQGTSNAASSIVLGDFSDVFVGLRTALQVSVLNERFADTGQVGFVSWLRADVLLVRPQSMARITGIIP